MQIWEPHPRVPDSVGLGWGWGTCILTRLVPWCCRSLVHTESHCLLLASETDSCDLEWDLDNC